MELIDLIHSELKQLKYCIAASSKPTPSASIKPTFFGSHTERKAIDLLVSIVDVGLDCSIPNVVD